MPKPPQKKRTSKSARSRSKVSAKPSRWRKLRRFLFWSLLLGAVVLSVYVVYLDQMVQQKLAGNRWTLPARVYAQPIELYQGAKITASQLEKALVRVGYRAVKTLRQAGQYRRYKNTLYVYTMGFSFWDGDEPSLSVKIRLKGGYVTTLMHAQKKTEIDLLRLEPEEIGQIHPAQYEDRILLQYQKIPKKFISTLVAVEDRKFYQHWGVDVWALGRAFIANFKAGRVVQGGSTLTQQLAKNFFLTRARTLRRKFNEVIIALLIEIHISKPAILEAYSNQIFLGQVGAKAIHGFQLASQHYFAKGLQHLSNAEMAMLVGMVKGPSYYHPIKHPKRARERRRIVLKQMRDQQVISTAEMNKALKQALPKAAGQRLAQSRYPAFLALVKQQLTRDYDEADLKTTGLKIFTTLKPNVQHNAESALVSQLKQLEREYRLQRGKLQGAVMVVSPQEGEVLAMVGDRRTRYPGFNRALHAYRPIGSLVKPAVYLTALQKNHTLTSALDDSVVALESPDGSVWKPKNYDGKAHGATPLYLALAKSYNLATVRLGMDVGLESVILTLRRLGYEKPIVPFPSVLLGTTEMSPYEVAQMYQTYASGGYFARLRAIRSVLDAHNQPLNRYPLTVDARLDSASVLLINHAMRGVIEMGSGRGLRKWISKDIVLVGKTGTTNDSRDSWFAGFGGDKVGVVWVGYDDNRPTKLTGSKGAMRVWGKMMQQTGIVSYSPPIVPQVHWLPVNPQLDLLAPEACEEHIMMPYVMGTEPQEYAVCTSTEKGWLDRWFQ